MRADLYPVDRKADRVRVDGWVSSPQVFRSTSRGVYIYVNGRFVRDRVIQHALFAGYRQRLVKGRFPMAALFVSLPSDQLDVNVHPTKREVRFSQQRLIHDLVQAAVAETLDREDRPRWGGADVAPAERFKEEKRISESRGSGYEAQSSKLKAENAEDKAESSRESWKGQRRIKGLHGRQFDPLNDGGLQPFGRKRKSAARHPDTSDKGWKYEPGTRGEQADFLVGEEFR